MNDVPDSAVAEVASIFRSGGWVASHEESTDFVVRKDKLRYLVTVKHAGEGRRDRVVPLVAQAVLEARHRADRMSGARPLVVVTSTMLPPKVVASIRAFVETYAADVAVGMVDSHGLREFVGEGLEPLNRRPSRIVRPPAVAKTGGLFSDLNQWMLKVLLAADLEAPQLLNAPIMRFRNATELAGASRVSIMTAFRLLEQLRSQGYLHEDSPVLRLVRVDELMTSWRAAAAITGTPIRAKWLLPGDRQTHLRRISRTGKDRVCVRSYAAADALGLGIVRGVPADLYVRAMPRDPARTLGLVPTQDAEVDVVLRIPRVKESVFRGAVEVNGILATDVLQAWLDVSHDPTRGRQQADHIHRKVIAPMLQRAGTW